MPFENNRWLWLSLVVLFSLAFLSLKPARGVITPAAVYESAVSKTANDRGVYQTKTDKVKSDLIVAGESESAKLQKDFLRTKKRTDMSGDSGQLGILGDCSRHCRNLSVVDFSPVLNM